MTFQPPPGTERRGPSCVEKGSEVSQLQSLYRPYRRISRTGTISRGIESRCGLPACSLVYLTS